MELQKEESKYIKGANEIKEELQKWQDEELKYFPPGEYGKLKLIDYINKFPSNIHGTGPEDKYYGSAANMLAQKAIQLLLIPGLNANCHNNVTLDQAIEVITKDL